MTRLVQGDLVFYRSITGACCIGLVMDVPTTGQIPLQVYLNGEKIASPVSVLPHKLERFGHIHEIEDAIW